jgi:hypothetical protein
MDGQPDSSISPTTLLGGGGITNKTKHGDRKGKISEIEMVKYFTFGTSSPKPREDPG